MPTPNLLQTIARQATAGVNPINSPAAFDIFKVKGPTGALYAPPCKIVECNGRETIAQEQQAPGMTGAILVTRGTHLVSVTYEITLWDQAGFAVYDALMTMLVAAQNARPQTSLVLTDLRLKNLRVPAVTPTVIPHQDLKSTGLWSHKVKFMENARLKIAGGPVQPARNGIEADILATQSKLDAANDVYAVQLASLSKNTGTL